MTLQDVLIRRITAQGPISVADYMSECLLHPDFGYYTTRAPFGQQGDFTTAPEISQMFGELIGLCLAQTWIDQGQPTPFTLAELGPGRGTLMRDVLRAVQSVPGFLAAADIHLLEASAALISEQKSLLADYSVQWVSEISELPDQPLFLVANEFFDALPIRQFQRSKGGWRERQVGFDGTNLAFGLGLELPQPFLTPRLNDTKLGDVVEYAPGVAPIVDAISTRIQTHGGAALIIDYGDWRSLGDTLQALRHHKSAQVLSEPGFADLTAHVDFEAVAQASRSAYTRLTTQGVFLERLGITQRAQLLAGSLSQDALKSHIAAHRRLTHPDEMGNLFKVLGLYPRNATPPPGLDA